MTLWTCTRTVEKNFVVVGGGGGGARSPPISWGGCGGGTAESGFFGRAFVKVACLRVVRLQRDTQGLVSLSLSLKILSTTDASRFFGLKWLRKALYGQSQRAPRWKRSVCKKGPLLAASPKSPCQRLPKVGGLWKRGSLRPPPPPDTYSPPPPPQRVVQALREAADACITNLRVVAVKGKCRMRWVYRGLVHHLEDTLTDPTI